MGSLDTIGDKAGTAIGLHVAACLEADGLGGALSPDELAAALAPRIDPRDAEGQWWTSLEAKVRLWV